MNNNDRMESRQTIQLRNIEDTEKVTTALRQEIREQLERVTHEKNIKIRKHASINGIHYLQENRTHTGKVTMAVKYRKGNSSVRLKNAISQFLVSHGRQAPDDSSNVSGAKRGANKNSRKGGKLNASEQTQLFQTIYDFYIEDYFQSKSNMSLFPNELLDEAWDPMTTMYSYIPIRRYPFYSELLRTRGEAYERRAEVGDTPSEDIPRKSLPFVPLAHIQMYLRPPTEGSRLCINADQCWLNDTASYIGKVFLLPTEHDTVRDTGAYPPVPTDFVQRTKWFKDSVRALDEHGSLNSFYAPMKHGKCVACIMHEVNLYMIMTMDRHQNTPIEFINPFRVIIRKGEFRKDVCYGQIHAGKPTGILGFFPILNYETYTLTSLVPDDYAIRKDPMDLGLVPDVLSREKSLYRMLYQDFTRPSRSATTGTTPSDYEEDIFHIVRSYKQLLSDGESTASVEYLLPRTHVVLSNVGFQ
jgi:hypothetical protein